MAGAVKQNDLYDTDFYAWTQDQAAKLRARARFDNRGDIDWENAAEEIESAGRSEKREIESRIAVLVLHLLKLRFQPGRRSRSWTATILEQRRQLARELQVSPSLKSYPERVLDEDYDLIRERMLAETDLASETVPATCPFTIAEILDLDFLPSGD